MILKINTYSISYGTTKYELWNSISKIFVKLTSFSKVWFLELFTLLPKRIFKTVRSTFHINSSINDTNF